MTEKTQRATCASEAPRLDQQKTILIVEDEKLVAWDMEQTLRDYDFQKILVTTSVRGARELVNSSTVQISIVILDLKLEDGDASVLIDEFSNCNIAVLVVTGYSEFSHSRVPVLYKPFATNALLHAISLLLASNG